MNSTGSKIIFFLNFCSEPSLGMPGSFLKCEYIYGKYGFCIMLKYLWNRFEKKSINAQGWTRDGRGKITGTQLQVLSKWVLCKVKSSLINMGLTVNAVYKLLHFPDFLLNCVGNPQDKDSIGPIQSLFWGSCKCKKDHWKMIQQPSKMNKYSTFFICKQLLLHTSGLKVNKWIQINCSIFKIKTETLNSSRNN